MKLQTLLVCAVTCWLAFLAQQGEGLFFTSGATTGSLVIGGSTTAGGANAAVLFGGLIVAKAVGLGVLALLLVRYFTQIKSNLYSLGDDNCIGLIEYDKSLISLFHRRGGVIEVVVGEGVVIVVDTVEGVKPASLAMKVSMTLKKMTLKSSSMKARWFFVS